MRGIFGLIIAAVLCCTTSALADSFATWNGAGIKAWNVDSDFRTDSIADYTYMSVGSWDWSDSSGTKYHAYFGVQTNPDLSNGSAIFSVFGPPGQVEGVRAADNGGSGTVPCVVDAVGTAEGKNVSCIVSGFPWKRGTWYTARIWAHGLRTYNGIEQENWGYWIREMNEYGQFVSERWIADFWVPRAWGYIPISDWGQFVETFGASDAAKDGGQGGCCYAGRIIGACGNPNVIRFSGDYYFAPPVPNQDQSLALTPIDHSTVSSACAPGTRILTSYFGESNVQYIQHGTLNMSFFNAHQTEFDLCSSVTSFVVPNCKF